MKAVVSLLAALAVVALAIWGVGLAANAPQAWQLWHDLGRAERELAGRVQDLRPAFLPEALNRLSAWLRSFRDAGEVVPSLPAEQWLAVPLPPELAARYLPQQGAWVEDGVLNLAVVPLARLRGPAAFSAAVFSDFPLPAGTLEVRVVRNAADASAYEGGLGWRRWVEVEN